MTFAPATLTTLGRYWTLNGGVNLGIVGDTRHREGGTSYHLGKSQLRTDAYSRQTERDKAGLSEAASAIDLGRLNGSLPELRRFSVWLVEQCQRRSPLTRDIREVIYSPDGKTVYGWSDLAGNAPIPGYGDASHLGHTHISFYRDSEFRPKTQIFAGYFVAPPDTSTEPDDMSVTIGILGWENGTATVSGDGHDLIRISDDARIPIAAGAAKGTGARVKLISGARGQEGKEARLVNHGGEACALLVADTTYTPAPTADCSAVELDLAVARAKIAAASAALR